MHPQLSILMFGALKCFYYRHWQAFHAVRRMEWSAMLAYLRPKRGERILDIASGFGYYCHWLAQRGCQPYGMDLDEYAISVSKHCLDRRCDFRIADAEKLPYQAGFFDKAYSVSCLEHFANDDKALAEMNRVLKRGGVLVLDVDALSYRGIGRRLRAVHAKRYAVRRHYTPDSLRRKLEQHGFSLRAYTHRLGNPVAHCIYQLGMKLNFAVLFLALVPVLYPLLLIAETLMPNREEGYMLIVKAVKR